MLVKQIAIGENKSKHGKAMNLEDLKTNVGAIRECLKVPVQDGCDKKLKDQLSIDILEEYKEHLENEGAELLKKISFSEEESRALEGELKAAKEVLEDKEIEIALIEGEIELVKKYRDEHMTDIESIYNVIESVYTYESFGYGVYDGFGYGVYAGLATYIYEDLLKSRDEGDCYDERPCLIDPHFFSGERIEMG